MKNYQAYRIVEGHRELLGETDWLALSQGLIIDIMKHDTDSKNEYQILERSEEYVDITATDPIIQSIYTGKR